MYQQSRLYNCGRFPTLSYKIGIKKEQDQFGPVSQLLKSLLYVGLHLGVPSTGHPISGRQSITTKKCGEVKFWLCIDRVLYVQLNKVKSLNLTGHCSPVVKWVTY